MQRNEIFKMKDIPSKKIDQLALLNNMFNDLVDVTKERDELKRDKEQMAAYLSNKSLNITDFKEDFHESGESYI